MDRYRGNESGLQQALVDRLSSTEVCTGSSLSSNGYRTPAKRSSGRRVTRFSWTLNLNGIIDIDQIEITIKDLHVFMNKSVNIDDSIGAGGRVCKKVCVSVATRRDMLTWIETFGTQALQGLPTGV